MAKFIIPLKISSKDTELSIYAPNGTFIIAKDANEFGEATYQLEEGTEYEYRFQNKNFCFNECSLVRPSEDETESRGRIITGNYVGTLHLTIRDKKNKNITGIDFEIRSKKTTYREDYRKMMNDITAYYTELVMMSSSPVSQKFKPDPNENYRTVYQRFSFVKSIIDSEDFNDALNKLFNNPVKKWEETLQEIHITSIKRIGRGELRQIASSSNRIPVDRDMALGRTLSSIPQRLSVKQKHDTIDTPENRFVKYVLTNVLNFCTEIKSYKNVKNESKLINEANLCSRKLENLLRNSFFHGVGNPLFINLNNPVLQHKEGYKEVFQLWIMFDLAAKLTWDGGDYVYNSGKKDVATLYEYWLFFKLLEIISNKFKLKKNDILSLVQADKNNINLNLRQGRMVMINGIYPSLKRKLYIRFSYNRTFGHNTFHDRSGSWTTSMRPDYTLSIWTGTEDEVEAERQNTIVHIHFDAKYRVNQILLLDKCEENLEHDTDNKNDDEITDYLNREKNQEKLGIYKRADLLKMHAYNDAIRRTGGSYILYPGSENKTLKGFHEIIPGLGAFPVNPRTFEADACAINTFLDDLINHFLNRISQREIKAYNDYETYLHKPKFYVNDPLPEAYGINRHLIPSKTNVLIGYYRNHSHLEWILKNKWYNTRTGTQNGSLRLDEHIMTAEYLLLHNGIDNIQMLLRLSNKGARIISGKQLSEKAVNTGYTPSSLDSYYIVFDLESVIPEKEFIGVKWDLKKMRDDNLLGKSHESAYPSGISLAQLMLYAVHS